MSYVGGMVDDQIDVAVISQPGASRYSNDTRYHGYQPSNTLAYLYTAAKWSIFRIEFDSEIDADVIIIHGEPCRYFTKRKG